MAQNEKAMIKELIECSNKIEHTLRNMVDIQAQEINRLQREIVDAKLKVRMMYAFMAGAIIKDGYKFHDEETESLFNELCEKCELPSTASLMNSK